MIKWFLRGVTHRRLTSRYPRRAESPPAGFRARALLDERASDPGQARQLADVCLPRALTVDERGRLQLDASRCIGCGLCAERCRDGSVTIESAYELAVRSRQRLVVGDQAREADTSPQTLSGAFRRSLHILDSSHTLCACNNVLFLFICFFGLVL